jgi:REP element-mobilizing transposase RayT
MIYWRYKRLDHHTPFTISDDSCYFLTVCSKIKGINQFCHPDIGEAILTSIRKYHEEGQWFCDLALLMPDHIHMLLRVPPNRTLTKVVGSWKQWLARKHGTSWQPNFFDHRLRNEEQINQKGVYILHNPVRAGLIESPEDWVYHWIPGHETSAAGDSGGYHKGNSFP